MVAILGYSREQILAAVTDMYTAVAEIPESGFHFPVGRVACEMLGYPPDQLDRVPEAVVESFAGVGYPFRADAIRPGEAVLDIGAGAGVDTLIASHLVGEDGHVTAIDLTPAMVRKLESVVTEVGIGNVTALEGSAENLPLPDESVDVITSNGALNLVPNKRRAVAEMFRVLRPGGRLQIADVVIRRPVTVDCHEDPRLWVECVVGATVDEDLLLLFRDAGFEDVGMLHTQDYFAHSPSTQTREVAADFGAYSAELGMKRGQRAPARALQWLRRWSPHRLAISLWRRGLAGTAALGLALLACYGTLAAVVLLSIAGVGLALDETLWAGTIAVFSLLAVVAVGVGIRRHRNPVPLIAAIAGAGMINYALFVDYHMIVELAGFVVLAAAVAWDVYQRRRVEQQVLGLQPTGLAT